MCVYKVHCVCVNFYTGISARDMKEKFNPAYVVTEMGSTSGVVFADIDNTGVCVFIIFCVGINRRTQF